MSNGAVNWRAENVADLCTAQASGAGGVLLNQAPKELARMTLTERGILLHCQPGVNVAEVQLFFIRALLAPPPPPKGS